MDRGAWRATVHGVAESDMTEQLSTHIRKFIFKKGRITLEVPNIIKRFNLINHNCYIILQHFEHFRNSILNKLSFISYLHLQNSFLSFCLPSSPTAICMHTS